MNRASSDFSVLVTQGTVVFRTPVWIIAIFAWIIGLSDLKKLRRGKGLRFVEGSTAKPSFTSSNAVIISGRNIASRRRAYALQDEMDFAREIR